MKSLVGLSVANFSTKDKKEEEKNKKPHPDDGPVVRQITNSTGWIIGEGGSIVPDKKGGKNVKWKTFSV